MKKLILIAIAVVSLCSVVDAQAATWLLYDVGCSELGIQGTSPDPVQVFVSGSDNTPLLAQSYPGNTFTNKAVVHWYPTPPERAYVVAIIDTVTGQTLLWNSYFQCGLPKPLPPKGIN